jgi:hypothetical protein
LAFHEALRKCDKRSRSHQTTSAICNTKLGFAQSASGAVLKLSWTLDSALGRRDFAATHLQAGHLFFFGTSREQVRMTAAQLSAQRPSSNLHSSPEDLMYVHRNLHYTSDSPGVRVRRRASSCETDRSTTNECSAVKWHAVPRNPPRGSSNSTPQLQPSAILFETTQWVGARVRMLDRSGRTGKYPIFRTSRQETAHQKRPSMYMQ